MFPPSLFTPQQILIRSSKSSTHTSIYPHSLALCRHTSSDIGFADANHSAIDSLLANHADTPLATFAPFLQTHMYRHSLTHNRKVMPPPPYASILFFYIGLRAILLSRYMQFHPNQHPATNLLMKL